MTIKKLGNNKSLLEFEGVKLFFSYSTPVAVSIDREGNLEFYKTEQQHSRTTTKHINSWLRAEGIEPAKVNTKPADFFAGVEDGQRNGFFDAICGEG